MKTQGDSLFDIVDKRDHGTVQAQLVHGGGEPDQDKQVSFFCRMNMSRTLKRQAGFGDVKVSLVLMKTSEIFMAKSRLTLKKNPIRICESIIRTNERTCEWGKLN